MTETPENNGSTPQCQYFVVRKKRLCRMTVRPGRQYCGEHEPQPKTEEGEDDKRIPCPLDPKHTCYASKLEKHLSICNARPTDNPPYIVWNVNAPPQADDEPRRPLCQYPRETIARVIRKVNELYEKHVEGNITDVPEEAIHRSVSAEFGESGRTESSRRHLRQAAALLRLAERAGLVADRTCYVELGAGKGQLSYYMGVSWCGPRTGSCVLAVDRAAMRHKKDGKLRGTRGAGETETVRGASEGGSEELVRQRESASAREIVHRLRADLRDVVLPLAPGVCARAALVGVAKHLCGVATDYALRCVCGVGSARGLVLATCCHHRCELKDFFGNEQLQELGITGEEFNVMLGIVSWATCGDGRSRRPRNQTQQQQQHEQLDDQQQIHRRIDADADSKIKQDNTKEDLEELPSEGVDLKTSTQLKEHDVTDDIKENIKEVKNKDKHSTRQHDDQDRKLNSENSNADADNKTMQDNDKEDIEELHPKHVDLKTNTQRDRISDDGKENIKEDHCEEVKNENEDSTQQNDEENTVDSVFMGKWSRAETGRRAKALVDWARCGGLRAAGWRPRLVRYVPSAVSPENVAILATRG